jgi:hypothetical protein
MLLSATVKSTMTAKMPFKECWDEAFCWKAAIFTIIITTTQMPCSGKERVMVEIG